MSITEIDPTLVAARVATVAATELLIGTALISPVRPLHWPIDPVVLAAYAMSQRPPSGETLFRRSNSTDWAAQPVELQLAYEVFAQVAWQVGTGLIVAQAERAAPPAPAPGLKREDSIFEEVESLGTLRPEAIEAARLQQAAAQAVPEAKAPSPSVKASTSPSEGEAKEGMPLSIGEAPMRPPVNRGGRGNRKTRD